MKTEFQDRSQTSKRFINTSLNYERNIIKIIISFTLHPIHSRVGRGNLLLRHSVPHFLPNSGGIACLVAELNAALCLDTRAKKWEYKFK